MQSEANGNVYQILVHEMNWKRALRFLFFSFFLVVGGGGGGEGRERVVGLFIFWDHDLLGGVLVLCIFISVSSVFVNTTCIQHQ